MSVQERGLTGRQPEGEPVAEENVETGEEVQGEVSPFQRIRDDLRSGRLGTREALARVLDTVVGDADAYDDESDEDGNPHRERD